jgi:hypothetical protein
MNGVCRPTGALQCGARVACIDRASHDARVSFATASEKRDRDGAIRRAFAEWRASADERRRSPSVAAA